MKTDNELIAEFMGVVVFQNDEELGGAGNDIEYEWCYRSNLKYNTSWDWLMPVVEKISNQRSGKFLSPCSRLQGEIAYQLQNVPGPKIEGVYKAVVEFIKWYNTQAPKVNP